VNLSNVLATTLYIYLGRFTRWQHECPMNGYGQLTSCSCGKTEMNGSGGRKSPCGIQRAEHLMGAT